MRYLSCLFNKLPVASVHLCCSIFSSPIQRATFFIDNELLSANSNSCFATAESRVVRVGGCSSWKIFYSATDQIRTEKGHSTELSTEIYLEKERTYIADNESPKLCAWAHVLEHNTLHVLSNRKFYSSS